MIRKCFLLFALAILAEGCTRQSNPEQSAEGSLFSLLTSAQTGVAFINQVEDEKEFNVLSYRNYYNGGGVAIGDVNADGLEDIYFTSNQHTNKLYLNKGNWQFEDITDQAGVGGKGAWTTGVTMADVNGDGKLDIYVCNSGDVPKAQRTNELFINHGNLTFSEEAKSYGLNSQAFSTHAAFFDYDLDGDLDCFLLNNSFRSPDRKELYKKSRDETGPEGGDILYKNEGGSFQDVSVQAGIHTGDIGFGLGVSVSDVNGDMLPDIYVSNDFWERDYLYINQGDGKFVDEIRSRVAMTSMNSMGADVADLNNDGFPEIMTTDMLPPDNYRLKTMTQFSPFRMGKMDFDSVYHHQIMQNCLQLNKNGRWFQEISNMAGVSATDWSWGALLVDFNLDGWKDVFVSNGIQRDLTDFDFVDIITNKKVIDQIVAENKGFDFRDFLPFMPSNKIANKAFINKKNLTFQEETASLGLAKPSFSNGSAYGDLDNDGDYDLVINNANMECFIYRNNTVEEKKNNFLKVVLHGPPQNVFGIGTKVKISKGEQLQCLQQFCSRGFQSSVASDLIFGVASVSDIDTLRVIWPDTKMQILTAVKTNQTLVLDYANATLPHTQAAQKASPFFVDSSKKYLNIHALHHENRFNDFVQEPLVYKMLSAEGPGLIKGDVNGDGRLDVILLGAADQANKLFVQQSSGKLLFKKMIAFENARAAETTCGALLDYDGDGDLDLLEGHGGNEFKKGPRSFAMRLFDNDGHGNFTINIKNTPHVTGNFSCIVPADIDRDGDLDLFIGARSIPGHYGPAPKSFLLQNNGDGRWVNLTNRDIGTLGMVTAATWSDIDHDGDPDLIVVGDWMPIIILENTPGAMKRKGYIPNSYGWWSSMIKRDLDGDGDDDFVLGNWGTNSKFQASPQEPLRMFVKDFDRNGTIEQILLWYPPGEKKAYPFATKDDLVKQLPFLKNKISKYADYGHMTYEDLFDETQRKGAVELMADCLTSAILWQDSTGFRLQTLPAAAQVSPVFSIVADDFNHDEKIDLLLLGNYYGLKPEGGRLDANRGVMLQGMEHGQFSAISNDVSGVYITGQVRDAAYMPLANGKKVLLVGRNNLPMMALEQK